MCRFLCLPYFSAQALIKLQILQRFRDETFFKIMLSCHLDVSVTSSLVFAVNQLCLLTWFQATPAADVPHLKQEFLTCSLTGV